MRFITKRGLKVLQKDVKMWLKNRGTLMAVNKNKKTVLNYIQKLRNFAFFIFVIILPYIFYVKLSKNWVPYGGFSNKLFYLEIPLYFLFYLFFYFPLPLSVKNKFFNKYIILPIIPFLGFYLIYDVFFLFLHRPLRLSDFSNFFLIALFDFKFFLLACFFIILILIPPFWIYLKWWQEIKSWKKEF